MKLGEKDLEILGMLQKDGKQSLKEMAKKAGIPITTVYDKIRKFEAEGVIKKYTAVLDGRKLGRPLTAFVFVSIKYHFPDEAKPLSQREIARKIAQIPNVQEVHIITGDWDLLLKVKGRDMEDISSFIVDKLRAIKGVDRTFTSTCLEVTKEGTEIALR